MFNKIFSSFQFRSVFLKIFFSLCGLALLPILLFGLFGDRYSQHVIQKEVEKSSLQMLDQTRRLVDMQLDDIDSMSLQLSNNESVIKAIEMNDMEEMDVQLKKIQSTLRENYTSSPYIDSLYIYYDNIEMIQSAITGLSPVEGFDQSGLIDLFKKMDKKRRWVSPSEYKYRETDDHSKTMTLIRPIPFIGPKNNGAIIVNVNHYSFSQTHSAQFMREDEEIWMLHPDGGFGFNTRLGKSLTTDEVDHISDELNGEMDTFIKNFRGQEHSFTSVTSPLTGWKYIYLVPIKTLNSNSYVIKAFTFSLSIIALVISIILAAILAKKIYRPFQTLLGIINSNKPKSVEKGKKVGEIPFILSSVEHFTHEGQMLREELDSNMLIIRESYLKTLIYEQSTNEIERLSKLEQYGITFNKHGFFVSILRIDHYDVLCSAQADTDVNLYKVFIEKVSEEVLAEEMNIASINMEGSDIILIGNITYDIDHVDETNEKVYELMKTISHQVTHYTDLSIGIGVGEMVLSVGLVSKSYEKAIHSIHLAEFKGNGSIIADWKIKSGLLLNNHVFEERKIAEEAILLAIKHKDGNQVNEVITHYFTSFTNFETYSFKIVQQILLSLVTSIIEKLGAGIIVEEELGPFFMKMIESQTIDDLKNRMTNLILELIKVVEEELKQDEFNVADHILDYVKSNYNKEISLNGIADKLKLDPSHISRVFKQRLGMNFMEHVITLRLTKGKDLLMNSELTVKEISQMVGYINTHSFIRIFKKYEGITPGKFREKENPKQLDIDKIY